MCSLEVLIEIQGSKCVIKLSSDLVNRVEALNLIDPVSRGTLCGTSRCSGRNISTKLPFLSSYRHWLKLTFTCIYVKL